jgi:Ca2+-binding EF-hand superfamily protein
VSRLKHLLLFILIGALSGPVLADDAELFGYTDQEWGQLRRDVDESARRSERGRQFEMRRKAILEQARARFSAADLDGNGSLNQTEFTRYRPVLARHFDRIDRNADGEVSEQELAQAWKKLQNIRRERGLMPRP